MMRTGAGMGRRCSHSKMPSVMWCGLCNGGGTWGQLLYVPLFVMQSHTGWPWQRVRLVLRHHRHLPTLAGAQGQSIRGSVQQQSQCLKLQYRRQRWR